VLGSDGNNDTAPPSAVDRAEFAVHVIAINAMGFVSARLSTVRRPHALCEAAGRWSFLCVIAPLRLALEPDPRLTPSRDCDAHPYGQAVIFWV